MRMAVDRRSCESCGERFARGGFVVLEGWIATHECETTVQRLLVSDRRVQALREAVGASDLRWISAQPFSPPRAGGGDAVVAVLAEQPSPALRRDSSRPSAQPVCARTVRDRRGSGRGCRNNHTQVTRAAPAGSRGPRS